MVVRKVVVVHLLHRQEGKLAVQVVARRRAEERRGKRKVVQQEIINEVYHKRTQLQPPLSNQW